MDNLLKEVSHCGKFQLCHVTLVQMIRCIGSWGMSLMIFGLYNPGWRCVLDSNSTFQQKEISLYQSLQSPLSNHNTSQKDLQTKMNSDFANNMSVLNSNSFNGTCDVINSCHSIEYNPSSSTVVTEFNLVCDKLWLGYVIISVLYAGMLIGSIVWGQIGERYGRKVGLYASAMITTISSGLAIFSPGWQVYALFTFLIGVGVSGAVPGSMVLSMEFLNPKWRAIVTSIPIWNCGMISFAFVAYVVRDWKYVNLIMTIISCLVCLGMFWTPESLRWLMLHGKLSRAIKVIEKISTLNGLTIQTNTLTDLIQQEKSNEDERKCTYIDLFRSREIRILSLKVGLVRAVSYTSYFIISYGIQSLPGDFYVNLIAASLIEIPFPLLVAPLANRIGRRWTGLLFSFINILCFTVIIMSLLSMEDGKVRGVLVSSLAFITRSSNQGLVLINFLQVAELYPTSVRNLSFGYLNIIACVLSMLSPYLIPRDHPSMVACFAVLLGAQIAAGGAVFSLVETRKTMLKDSIKTMEHKKNENDRCEIEVSE